MRARVLPHRPGMVSGSGAPARTRMSVSDMALPLLAALLLEVLRRGGEVTDDEAFGNARTHSAEHWCALKTTVRDTRTGG